MERRTGNTTRRIDEYIQQLFNNPDTWIVIRDPWENGEHRQANENLLERLLRRIDFEHHIPIIDTTKGIKEENKGKVYTHYIIHKRKEGVNYKLKLIVN